MYIYSWKNFVFCSTDNLFIDEDITNDSETNHINETIDYFVIDDNGGAGIFIGSLLPIALFSFDAVLNKDKTVQ